MELLRKHSVRRLFEKLTTELEDGLACSSDKQPSSAVGKERVGGTIKDESRSLLLERAEDGVVVELLLGLGLGLGLSVKG